MSMISSSFQPTARSAATSSAPRRCTPKPSFSGGCCQSSTPSSGTSSADGTSSNESRLSTFATSASLGDRLDDRRDEPELDAVDEAVVREAELGDHAEREEREEHVR